ncbi:MAG: lasso peptide biosynthesis B2 protein [Micromonosporaceae bacterium]|nr:lasso peptide biosynthesis B2 protein [Micromonosporaceae bacterium]
MPAQHVRTIRTPHVTLIVDYHTGDVAVLTGATLATWLSMLQETPTVSVTSRQGSVVAGLAARGWLITGREGQHRTPAVYLEPSPASWGTQEAATQLNPIAASPWWWRLAAVPAVLVTLAVRHIGHSRRRFARMVALANVGSRLTPATADSARHAVRAVRWAARLIPARVACLEESVAAGLLLASAGCRARWVHGIAIDPLRLHAWLADEAGRPIDEAADTIQYTPINQDQTGGARE